MIPAPPKVCKLELESEELPLEPVEPVPLVPEVDPGVLPLDPELLEPNIELLPIDDPKEEFPKLDEEPRLDDDPKLEGEPNPEELEPDPPFIPPFPLGPMPPAIIPPDPPVSGWPKKPRVCVLACPHRTGFQSSLPVVGSMYFLRRKRISLVFTRAFWFGGKAWKRR